MRDRTEPRTSVVIAALDEEIAGLRRRRARMELWVTGDGALNARRGAQRLLDRHAIGRLVVIGISGAITSDLAPGDLVVARIVASTDGAVFHPDPSLVAIACDRLGAIPGTVVATPTLVRTGAECAELAGWAQTDRALVADLESAEFAEAAERRGVPYVVLRAVSDTRDAPLPDVLDGCQRADGSIDRTLVARRAFARPSSWIELARLRARVSSCANRLASAVEEFCACAPL
jgi:hypothetical protein